MAKKQEPEKTTDEKEFGVKPTEQANTRDAHPQPKIKTAEPTAGDASV